MARVPDEVPERVSFPKEEERVLDHWRSINAFETSNRLSAGRPVFSFYDGPPFATGLPHYGHLLAGTIKDTVTRFAYQTGHHVPRRFGWDCHGLPIEFEIEKKLGIKTREEILAMGIDKYNSECRGIVMRFRAEWETFVNRIGRWIDFENDYKTLDTSYMESVWWVFKALHEKGLVYRGFKVMPYSTGCTTPLSNFEANLNYKDTNDPAVTVRFPILTESPEDPYAGASFLAWTTTPWTLPSNLALCVHPELTYVFVLDKTSGRTYILCESRLVQLYKNPQKNPSFEIFRKVKGAELVGLKYEPLFLYFCGEYGNRAFKVLSDTYVTDSDGTGIVHQAPAFGEDDYRVCLANAVIDKGERVPCPVDDNGRFISPVTDFAGIGVKDADKLVIAKLKQMDRLVKSENINHSYPYCWRSDTPLIYKAVASWFVAVEEIKQQLIYNNAETKWVPESVQLNRFGNWLENARDWNVSRNRYWGTPIPIWRNSETGEMIVIGSIQELSDLSNVPVNKLVDLHRDSVDHIEIISPKTGDRLKRVPEVFDCWFESGSMPYGSIHYPFGKLSETEFARAFPADFVAEGLDQTRGWFYTLMVLSTALFNRPAFKNCVVNGMVLAADGKKMSKRLKNYPDPILVLDSHGADALRLYLINSPVVRGEPLRFREDGVRDVIRDVMLPWFNAYRFLIQNVRMLAATTGKPLALEERARFAHYKNQMDLWIESCLGSLISYVLEEMGANRLYNVVPKLLGFIDELTNWYVRLNRPRLKGSSCSEEGQRAALSTLGHVLLTLSRLMSPFAPFFSEYTYQSLKLLAPPDLVADSVHYLMLPAADRSAVDTSFEEAVRHMQEVILLGRIGREHRDLAIKKPLKEALIIHRDEAVLSAVRKLESYVMLELNVRSVKYSTDESSFVLLKADADGRSLGKKLGKAFKSVHAAVRAMSPEQVALFETTGSIELEGHVLSSLDVKISRELRPSNDHAGNVQVEASSNGMLLVLNTELDENLVAEGMAREIMNRVQRLRKKAHLEPKDRIEIFIETSHQALRDVIQSQEELFSSVLNVPCPLPAEAMTGREIIILRESVEPVNDMDLEVCITRAGLVPSVDRLKDAVDGDVLSAEAVAAYLRTRSPKVLEFSDCRGDVVLVSLLLGDKAIDVAAELGKHFFRTTADRISAGAGP